MDTRPEKTARQTAEDLIEYCHRMKTRKAPEPSSRSAENRPIMIKIDTKLADMRDEQFIKAMMGYQA